MLQQDRPVRVELVNMKAILSERELAVLRLRYRDGYTEAEIADAIGTHQSTVSRLISAAIERLREEKNVILDLSA